MDHYSPLQILILQHPQEPGVKLGTVPLIQSVLGARVRVRVGLSWPNLARAYGGEPPFTGKDWMALYLGSTPLPSAPGLYEIRKKEVMPLSGPPRGLILLDGTWSQAKTLWWRNAWLLKCRRGALRPAAPSLYGKKRKEPRAECLSTLESLSQALAALGEAPPTQEALHKAFAELLA